MPLLTNGPSRFLGGRGGIATPLPTVGAELLANNGFESWAGATDANSWGESLNGTTTINRDSTNQHSGTYCVRIDVDSSSNNSELSQNVTGQTVGDWYLCSWWMKASTAGKTARYYLPNLVSGGPLTLNPVPTDWTQYFFVDRTANVSLAHYCRINAAANSSIYFDDLSTKKITLASTFAGVTQASADMDISAPVTLAALGTRAGVVARLDSLVTPANFLIASHDGTRARLTQCKAGVYTELVNTAVTYAAGAAVRIWVSGTTAKLYYNGAQVGTNQTIDAAITGVIFGKFNTYATNAIGSCTIVAAA